MAACGTAKALPFFLRELEISLRVAKPTSKPEVKQTYDGIIADAAIMELRETCKEASSNGRRGNRANDHKMDDRWLGFTRRIQLGAKQRKKHSRPTSRPFAESLNQSNRINQN